MTDKRSCGSRCPDCIRVPGVRTILRLCWPCAYEIAHRAEEVNIRAGATVLSALVRPVDEEEGVGVWLGAFARRPWVLDDLLDGIGHAGRPPRTALPKGRFAKIKSPGLGSGRDAGGDNHETGVRARRRLGLPADLIRAA
jgi:hypothetical protein